MNSTHIANPHHHLSNLRPVADRFGWMILAVYLLVVYMLVNFVFPGRVASGLNLHLFQPMLWLSLAFLTHWLWSLQGESSSRLAHRRLILSAALIGGMQVTGSILLGFLTGFGNSPYSHALSMILLNFWFVMSKLAGIEMARWYLGKTIGNMNTAFGYLTAWLVPFIVFIPVGKFSLLSQPESAFRLVGGTLIPVASENLLAAYLALSAGPLASITYFGVMQFFEWLSPILPDLPWLAEAFVGALVPLLGLIVLNHNEDSNTENELARDQKNEKEEQRPSVVSWLLVAALAVAVVCFNSGALGVRPSLISGNSMNPVLYPGDVVITRVITPENVQVGDVVRFHRDRIDVVHRVMEIQSSGATLLFITRGDNNNVNDEPVMADQLEGKVVLTIPKIGWIGIFFRQVLARAGGTP